MPLSGKPLVAWSIEVSLLADSLDAVFLSTDRSEIAQIGHDLGVEVIQRPRKFGMDTTPMSDVISHAVSEIGDEIDLVLLEPTSPLRYPWEIDAAVALLAENPETIVVTAHSAIEHPELIYVVGNNGDLIPAWSGKHATRRQDRPRALTLNGLIYAISASCAAKSPDLRHHPMKALMTDVERSVSIDYQIDLAKVERWLAGHPNFPHESD